MIRVCRMRVFECLYIIGKTQMYLRLKIWSDNLDAVIH